jgi:flagellar hook-associated protein 1
MADILNIATSSLNAYKVALDTIGNNIANANTPGYSRQEVSLSSQASQRFGTNFVGSGANIDAISRISDQFVNSRLRDTLSSYSQFDTFFQQASQVDRLLSESSASVSHSIQEFFTALEQVNESPDNIASRNVLMSQTQLMVNRFNSIEERLDELFNYSRSQIQESVNQINTIAKSIADINNQITNTKGTPPELLDKRDQLLVELAQFTNINTADQGNGTISVSIGSGELIVIGAQVNQLSVGNAQGGFGNTEIFLQSNNALVAVSQNLRGGSLAGLFNFEQSVLQPASQIIGQMAIGLAQTFNQQHQLGLDMNGNIGSNFFTDFNSTMMQSDRVVASSGNIGSAQFSVTVSDINQTQISDYELLVTNSATNQVQITRRSDNVSSTVTLTDSPPAPPSAQVVIDGMTITVDDVSNLSDGDFFNIEPTRGGAANLGLLFNGPEQFALASPVRTESSLSNTGEGEINLAQIIDPSLVSATKEYRIDFLSGTQYNLVNVTDSITTGPFAFTPNTDNTVSIPDALTPAYTITLSGSPQSGDNFTAEFNSGGIGDNRNGLLLSQLQTQKGFANNTQSIFDRYSALVVDVGSKTYQAKLQQEAADIIHQQAVAERESKSGVNLDEEAANLLRFQQAYQAASQLVVVTNRIMDILFNTFSR